MIMFTDFSRQCKNTEKTICPLKDDIEYDNRNFVPRSLA
jgi:hypothetical protein